MDTTEIYITCVSWEERFHRSFKSHLEKNEKFKTISFLVKEFDELSEKGIRKRSSILLGLDESNHRLVTVSSRDDVLTWTKVSKALSDLSKGDKVTLDVSTMPRYLIWTVLHFLDSAGVDVSISYCKPESYCNNGLPLTREPLRPRLILKHSGVFLPGRNTVLIAQVGFDYDRLVQLITTYEPEKVILVTQEGDQFGNAERHNKEKREKLSFSNLEFASVNSYDHDHGYKVLKDSIDAHKDNKNIVMAALGPKITTAIMYQLNKEYPCVGLVDVPIGQYNSEYSKGADCKNMLSIELNL